MKIKEFVNEFVTKKVANTKANPNAVAEFINKNVEFKTYLPFQTKRKVVDIIVSQSIREEDGVKKVDSIAQYLSFIIAMIGAHTNLELNIENPADDYDSLNSCGLLEPIISSFQRDYAECEVLLKMAIADELTDNNLNVIVGKFFMGVLDQLDDLGDVLKGTIKDIDIPKLLGEINKEDIAKIMSFINKSKK